MKNLDEFIHKNRSSIENAGVPAEFDARVQDAAKRFRPAPLMTGETGERKFRPRILEFALSAVVLCLVVGLLIYFAPFRKAVPASSPGTSQTATATAVATPTQTPEPTPIAYEEIYQKAVRMLRENKLVTAYSLFCRAGEYKDSKEQAADLRYVIYYYPIGNEGRMAITKDGSVINSSERNQTFYSHIGTWTDVVALNGGSWISNFALKNNGTVNMFSKLGAYEGAYFGVPEKTPRVAAWTDIIQVVPNGFNMTALRKDGTILFADDTDAANNSYAQAWSGIIQLTSNLSSGLIGLKSDGMLAMSDATALKYPSLKSLSNVVMIADGLALQSDGTVVDLNNGVTLRSPKGNWRDIVAVFPGSYGHLVMNSEGVLIDRDGNEYRFYEDVAFAMILGETVIGVRTGGQPFVRQTKDGSATPPPSGTTFQYLENAGLLLTPTDWMNNKFADAATAAKRFDPNSAVNDDGGAFPYLDGKYHRLFVKYGSDECGYVGDKAGIADSSGNVIIEPAWAVATPVTDDRFVLLTRGSIYYVTGYQYIITDRAGNQISPETFNQLRFTDTTGDKLYPVGLARIYGENGTQVGSCFLVDTSGNRLDGEVWDNQEFNENGTIRAERGGQVYTLDLRGKIIP